MADEISFSIRCTVTNGTFKHDLIPSESPQFDQTTQGGGVLWLDIGTSAENVSFGDGSPGYIFLKNHDPTNYVEFRETTATTSLGRLDAAGGIAVFKLLSGSTLEMVANTAACKVEARFANA